MWYELVFLGRKRTAHVCSESHDRDAEEADAQESHEKS